MHPTEPISAGIQTMAWLAGRWLGEHAADRIEEWWTEPHAGMMLCLFRWHRDGEARFYELASLESELDRVVFRIKHFAPGLIGWEEKDEAVTLDLVAVRDGEAIFLKRGEERWMVYQRQPDGELHAWFETVDHPREAGDEFRYARA